MHFATISGKADLVQLILEKKIIDIKSKNIFKRTALDIARDNKLDSIFNILNNELKKESKAGKTE